MGKATKMMEVTEQKVVRDEPVLSKKQMETVMGHIKDLHEGYKKLYAHMVECSHTAEGHKKRKIHKMMNAIVEKQQELDHFHRHFDK